MKIRLTENDLHNIVKESVKQCLMELDPRTYVNAATKRKKQGNIAAANGLKQHGINTFNKRYGYDKSYSHENEGAYDHRKKQYYMDDDMNLIKKKMIICMV